MNGAYVDTSALLAVAFGEPAAPTVGPVLDGYARLASSNLMEAEFRSAHAREGVVPDPELLGRIDWILPGRRLGSEMERALEAARLPGPDLFHVAAALFAAGGDPSRLPFLTLDVDQRAAASALGFPTPL